MYFPHLITALCHQADVPTKSVIEDNLYDQFFELQRKQNREKEQRKKHKRDILIRIAKQNRCPTPTLLPDMLERFPPPDEEGDDDDDEDTPIAPSDYEKVLRPDHSSMRGMMIHDLS
ncbi:hypothetical protein J1N35_028874 [Gossypium stocksii]|uniref:Uncharacterized protein n=1 Tax=Gossypium stocksii TaxID=47602 RepID=A0A9D3UWT9_9ROSI|nr:hypothetical protein J1N35_028874 [Gossypium stocksii]